MLSALDIESLLTETAALFETLYVVEHDFSLVPTKQHVATCIKFADLEEMRDDFVEELVGTLVPFVYSPEKSEEVLERFRPKRTEHAARERLRRHCVDKFRRSSSRGQFSELLLCNLLQHHFRAAPLVRKIPITTNPAVERHGADAIHIANKDGKIRFYLGEAKTYAQAGGVRAAFRAAVDDIVNKHYANFRNELNLYVYESFLPPELEQAAQDFREGRLAGAEVHLVCIVTYDLDGTAKGATAEARMEATIQAVRDGVKNVCNTPIIQSIDPDVLPRLNYILFPVRKLDDLVNLFRAKLGIV